MRLIALIIVLLCGGLLLYATADFPAWGDPNSPASTHVSPRYIEKGDEETHTPNMVTAVLADYRSYDTMGEAAVVFTAAVGCMLILRRRQHK